jgi:hypothetical protein
MVTQTTGEQTTGKRRGRPKKDAAPVLKAPPAQKGERGSDFERLVKAHSKDTIVKAFFSLRRKLFKEGSPVDAITAQLSRRISDIQSKGNIVH